MIPRGGYDVEFRGEGELLKLDALPDTGLRTLQVDSVSRKIVAESLAVLPSTWVVRRTGTSEHRVALTFDDGPDPLWTPKILDILKQENVKATFFIVGENGQTNPDLVKRIVADGQEIGNHSFTHPNH